MDGDRSGKALFDGMKQFIKMAEEEYGIEVVAVCTDSGGAERYMRKLMSKDAQFDRLVILPCMAHQVRNSYKI